MIVIGKSDSAPSGYSAELAGYLCRSQGVCGSGLFHCGMEPEISRRTIYAYTGLPHAPLLVPADALSPTRIVRPMSCMPSRLALRCDPEIGSGVVETVTITMVHASIRPQPKEQLMQSNLNGLAIRRSGLSNCIAPPLAGVQIPSELGDKIDTGGIDLGDRATCQFNVCDWSINSDAAGPELADRWINCELDGSHCEPHSFVVVRATRVLPTPAASADLTRSARLHQTAFGASS